MVDGKPLRTGSVVRSIQAGVCLVPEDRKRQGLVLSMSVRHNTSLASLDQISIGPVLDLAEEERVAIRMVESLGTKTASIDTPVAALSGGNQQKVVLAKWLARRGGVLIVDEPTRGVDIGAKQVIHQLLDRLARDGLAILMISSELPELLASADRILVMREGKLVSELSGATDSEKGVLRAMIGGSEYCSPIA